MNNMTDRFSHPSALARNYAFMQLIETYFTRRDKQNVKVHHLGEEMLENLKTVQDPKMRSYLLREIAINLYLANHERDLAIEAAKLIPDREIRAQTLRKIGD